MGHFRENGTIITETIPSEMGSLLESHTTLLFEGVSYATSYRTMMVHSDDLTGCQRKSLLEFLNIKRKTKCNVREPLWFALVLAGEKPGCLISAQRSTVEESFPSFSLTTMAEAFNLAYTEHFEASLDIASSPWRIEMLPSKHFDLCSEEIGRAHV